MERVRFIDPFAGNPQPSGGRPDNLRPVPAPPNTPAKRTTAVPSRGREREIQQLIHDLAVLAATSKPSAK